MPGPQPNPNALRRNNAGDWRTLPAVCELAPPAWPIGNPDTEVAAYKLARWATLWATPQAVIWHEQATAHVVARYLDLVLLVEGGMYDHLAEVRQIEDRLLINPSTFIRARLLVAVEGEDDEQGEDGDDGVEAWGDNVVSMLG